MNYYDEIKENLIKCEIYDKDYNVFLKDYSKDRYKVSVYYEIGKLLSEAGKEYGKNIIKQYSEKLMIEVGKKYKVSNLYKMRKFYEKFNDEKLYPLGTKLCWSHYRELLTIKNVDEIIYYIHVCEECNLSRRQLREKIKNHEYNRLSDETKIKLIKSKELKVNDLVPNTVLIKSDILKDELSEYALKQIILNNIDDNKTVGIIICKKNNQYVIDYCSDNNIIAREYELII